MEIRNITDVQPLDCGNNPCWFATETGGMRTQGGCRCLQDLPLTSSERRVLVHQVRHTIKAHVEKALRAADRK